jgi:hypothetical protein
VPNACVIEAGTIGVHAMFAGRGLSDRVTVPMKPLTGFMMMTDEAEVVPSAGATAGEVVPIVKSGLRVELTAQCGAMSDAELRTTRIGAIAIQRSNTDKRIL